jgi:hypothetical protein
MLGEHILRETRCQEGLSSECVSPNEEALKKVMESVTIFFSTVEAPYLKG